MTVQELAEKILQWIERTRRETASDQKISETYVVDRMDVLIDDIEALCKEQAEARANDLLIRYAEETEVTIKTDCLTCHSLMEGTWSGEPPYTIVCAVCGQSYTIDIERSHEKD